MSTLAREGRGSRHAKLPSFTDCRRPRRTWDELFKRALNEPRTMLAWAMTKAHPRSTCNAMNRTIRTVSGVLPAAKNGSRHSSAMWRLTTSTSKDMASTLLWAGVSKGWQTCGTSRVQRAGGRNAGGEQQIFSEALTGKRLEEIWGQGLAKATETANNAARLGLVAHTARFVSTCGAVATVVRRSITS